MRVLIMDPEIIIPIVVFTSIAICVYTWITRSQATKQKQLVTLQALAESNSDISKDAIDALMPNNRAENDYRRGVLLFAIGLLLTLVLFFEGGNGWMIGLFPTVIGGIYIAFSKRTQK